MSRAVENWENDPVVARSRKRWTAGLLSGCLGVPGILVTMFIVLESGCLDRQRDLTNVPPYSAMVGRTYQIVGDVDAYGVSPGAGTDVFAVSVLARDPGIGGSEITFTRPLARGQTFRILSAWMVDRPLGPFFDGIHYLIDVKDPPFPARVPVRLRLGGSNGSKDGELNPKFYEEVKPTR